ncbi:hypothetical protein [Metapseudomonas furukawaii]|uniref:Uncharacterized protein n=1 Tax=Metapseudomonas furukawaii TaxID=1149133 RepID=A0AAD1C621_METFU|nr:hypothetical protein [Pseudomonas furukawaii]BAU77423.1 hypothetical protein KF707C_p340 [Pseudomonas furukawaii]
MNTAPDLEIGSIPENVVLKGLLARWLRIDDFSDDTVAPLALVEATRNAVEGNPVSPRVVLQLAGGSLQSVNSNILGLEVRVVDYDRNPEAVANTRGLDPIIPLD